MSPDRCEWRSKNNRVSTARSCDKPPSLRCTHNPREQWVCSLHGSAHLRGLPSRRCVTADHELIDPMDPEFWAFVDRTDTCWLWTGPSTTAPVSHGGLTYGRFLRWGGYKYAHRYAYELLVGPIADGLVIDHLCRVTLCVNPAHLEPVTPMENVGRGSAATKTHCKQGHPLAPRLPGARQRRCLVCKSEGSRRAYYRDPEATRARTAASRDRHRQRRIEYERERRRRNKAA